MKKLLLFAFCFAFFAGSTVLACDSCAAHKKTDNKEESAKDAKKCDKEDGKKDCDKCPSKK